MDVSTIERAVRSAVRRAHGSVGGAAATRGLEVLGTRARNATTTEFVVKTSGGEACRAVRSALTLASSVDDDGELECVFDVAGVSSSLVALGWG
jgi:RNase P/RNase MRP subunit POP5